jgi:hypothetical protein
MPLGYYLQRFSEFVSQYVTLNPFPSMLEGCLVILLTVALNFGAPLAAWRLSRRFNGHGWWMHVAALLWVCSSLFVAYALLLPPLPADQAPGPGDGFMLIPTLLSVAIVLPLYCITLVCTIFLSFLKPRG